MNITKFLSGYVEKIYTHGKLGIIRGLDERYYFFNESSFNPISWRKRLKVGEAVVFRCFDPAGRDGKYPLVSDMRTVDEVMKKWDDEKKLEKENEQ